MFNVQEHLPAEELKGTTIRLPVVSESVNVPPLPWSKMCYDRT